jgi:hypothetical protein
VYKQKLTPNETASPSCRKKKKKKRSIDDKAGGTRRERHRQPHAAAAPRGGHSERERISSGPDKAMSTVWMLPPRQLRRQAASPGVRFRSPRAAIACLAGKPRRGRHPLPPRRMHAVAVGACNFFPPFPRASLSFTVHRRLARRLGPLLASSAEQPAAELG